MLHDLLDTVASASYVLASASHFLASASALTSSFSGLINKSGGHTVWAAPSGHTT